MGEQLRLNLDDDRQYFKRLIESNPPGSDQQYRIFLVRGKLFLGTRTHDIGGTDYSYDYRITRSQAEILLNSQYFDSSRRQIIVVEHLDALKDFDKDQDELRISSYHRNR